MFQFSGLTTQPDTTQGTQHNQATRLSLIYNFYHKSKSKKNVQHYECCALDSAMDCHARD